MPIKVADKEENAAEIDERGDKNYVSDEQTIETDDNHGALHSKKLNDSYDQSRRVLLQKILNNLLKMHPILRRESARFICFASVYDWVYWKLLGSIPAVLHVTLRHFLRDERAYCVDHGCKQPGDLEDGSSPVRVQWRCTGGGQGVEIP